ncbi:TrkH family potassium uptake protein [Acetonema longum]|uniref:Potassium uptake protein, TrkH family n=1 Tax=Acetonema longum DSM 6540 TaxID=1009370 RepID=F7NNF9_9FIRM|nr:TrkH family potassium uptake protein [Acetonema longum]EGO62400.1 potassium uptake protein, TrkH family [Acetonema longum DSM 6540]
MKLPTQQALLRSLIDTSEWKLTPYQILVLGFAVLIFLGTFLLMTPLASASGQSLSFIDALFTATSAVCVTGLVVVDTGTYFTLFGQMVIIFLIQVGGLGIMTMTTLMALLTGKKIRLRERLVIQEALNQLSLAGVVKLTSYIIKVTLCIEFIGGTILALRWYDEYSLMGIYMGYWHAVSSFCNAGFDLFGHFSSLTHYVGDFTVNMTVCSLIILGGIGFTVISDVRDASSFRRCSLHTRIVLMTTAVFLVAGTIGIFFLELLNVKTLGSLSWVDKLLASFFQSVTTRTAGYNTLDISQMNQATWLYMIFLMFIGASPASTGGGIKTSTFAVIVMAIGAFTRGKTEAEIFERRISHVTTYKAFTVFFMAAGLVVLACMVLSITEQTPFINILFEVVSAFGTVGLSTGITPGLSPVGKIGIIITMFAGRVGLMTIILALVLRERKKSVVQYPEGKIIIG